MWYKKLTIAAILILLVVFFFLLQKTNIYTISVRNNSPLLVESVRVFGTAVEGDHIVLSLASGQEQSLSITLKNQGTLKYEVHQSLTRVDSFIVQDVAELKSLKQQLLIEPGNRFLISDLP